MKTKYVRFCLAVSFVASCLLAIMVPTSVLAQKAADVTQTPVGSAVEATAVAPQPDTAKIAAEVTQMTTALSELMASKEKLAAKKDELTSQIDDLNKKAADLQISVSELEKNKKAKEEEIGISNKKTEELSRQISNLQNALQALQKKSQDEKQELTDLEQGTYIEYTCADGVKKRGALKAEPEKIAGSECDLVIHLYYGQIYKPARLTILDQSDNNQSVYDLGLKPVGPTEITVESSKWFVAKRYSAEGKYVVKVDYDYQFADTKDTYSKPINLMTFRLAFKRWIPLQITGKIYTAWRLDETNGDTSFLLPGLAFGTALRFRKLPDPGDVLALRLVFAAGPNLLAKQSSEDKDAKSKFQIIGGFELSILRYISVGCAWVLLGSKDDGALSSGRDHFNGTPLLLVTYGDLYPAATPIK